MKRLFAFSAQASLISTLNIAVKHMSGYATASNEDEARALVLKYCDEQYLVSEGHFNHSVSITEIPADVMRNILQGMRGT